MRLSKLNSKSDLELLQRYKQRKDPEIIGELFKRYTGFVYAICMKYLKDDSACNDAVMGIFEQLFDKLLQHDVHNFKSWLHTLTRNFCLLQLRGQNYANKNLQKLAKDGNSFMEHDGDMHQEDVFVENQLQLMEQCIPQLKDEQRICVELFYLEKKSYIDISEHTGYNVKKVKSYIQNGKRNLKIMMENYNEQQEK